MPMTGDSASSRPAEARRRPSQSPTRRAVTVLLGRDAVTSPGRAGAPGVGGNEEPGALVRLRLVLLSFLMLFVELALIRWLGANIVYLSYYSNFVLLGSFLAVAAVMAMIGEGVARTFVRFKPLEAYRLDILGSIVGIATFSALSFFDAKPLAWGIITAVALLAAYGRRIGLIPFVALASLAGLLTAQSLTSHDLWSPYYRITVGADTPAHTIPIMVNGIPHQAITRAAKRPAIFYRPYTQAPGNPLNNVLVVGAGTGNDVAGALRMGAKHVDAVEIDPMIYKLGRKLNGDQPYQDPRVSVHINDGRAFLSQTEKKYDLILFALPDSLTLVAGQSSLRLESYLFTLQAMQSARAHLVPSHGVFAMYNYYRTTWLRDRLAST